MNALSNKNITIKNLSDSDDTKVLVKLLQHDSDVYDVDNAGTVMRFLTAYLSFKEGTQILTGSTRMQKRPIAPLVASLNQIGARIEYLGEEGFPPIALHSPVEQRSAEIVIDASVSSQFISALVMIAPTLPLGLTIKLAGKSVSTSYIFMTLDMMTKFGIKSVFENDTITIAPQVYAGGEITVESDWSAAGFYLGMAALSRHCDIKFQGLSYPSVQGDSAAMKIFDCLGVTSIVDSDGIHVQKGNFEAVPSLKYNFNNYPDLVQCAAVTAAGKGISFSFTGIETLFIKETDRMAALCTELAKVNVTMTYDAVSAFVSGRATTSNIPVFDTYKDHRMAMSLAILAVHFPIIIENPEVVTKSYPQFWDDLAHLGFLTQIQN